MAQLYLDFPPPDNWQDFERLTRALCAIEWNDPDTELVGRPGQAQDGVDVLGWERRQEAYRRIGVQCKRRSATEPDGAVRVGGLITLKEFTAEIAKSEAHRPPIQHFVMATTAAQDAELQREIAVLSSERRHDQKSTASIWFWEWFQERLNRHVELLYQFYEGVLRSHGAYNPEAHVAAIMRTAFDRPLMKTPFHLESSIKAVGEGISRLQQLMATGLLKDAEGETVASGPPPRNVRNMADGADIEIIQRELQTLRNEFAEAVSQGTIIDQGFILEIREYAIRDRMNTRRATILRRLNQILMRYHLAPIQSPLLE
jgi:hypothetical protein